MAADCARRGCFLLFAKAPEPARAKTRLISAIGVAGAAAVARALLENAARALRQVPPGWEVSLCADDPDHPALRTVAERYGYTVRAQGEGTLGERMQRLARSVLASGVPAAVLVGSDCTGYDAAYLHAACDALDAGNDAVLGPAEDGGYVLLGLRRVPPGLFDGIAWGGSDVADAQRARLEALGMRWRELPLRADVDLPQDLWMLCPALARRAQALVIARLSP